MGEPVLVRRLVQGPGLADDQDRNQKLICPLHTFKFSPELFLSLAYKLVRPTLTPCLNQERPPLRINMMHPTMLLGMTDLEMDCCGERFARGHLLWFWLSRLSPG